MAQKVMQKDEVLKPSLVYIVSLRPMWAKIVSVSQKKRGFAKEMGMLMDLHVLAR